MHSFSNQILNRVHIRSANLHSAHKNEANDIFSRASETVAIELTNPFTLLRYWCGLLNR